MFPFELPAESLQQAAELSKTEYFWYIYGGNDYNGFNFHITPVPWESHHVYVYASQWQADAGVYLAHADHVSTPTYNFRQEQHVVRLPNTENWTVPEDIDSNTVDFSWHPSPHEPAYIYHFSDDYQEFSGLVYTVPGATEIKPTEGFNTKSRVLDIFFVDKNNQQSAQRFAKLQKQHPTAQRIRYANSMLDTVKRCATRTNTNKFWVISSENIYDDFDFAWHANSWQGYMTHVFGSKWQKWSDTYLFDKWVFERNAKWANSIAEFPDLNFVTNQQVVIPEDGFDVFYIDHHNASNRITSKFPNAKTTRFVDNYLDTLKRVMSSATTEYVWITSSLCDYSKFDFSWQPEPWQSKMLHVFPSNNQKFGDTFYIHVETFKQQMHELELLEWFDTVNFCTDQTVPRIDFDRVIFNSDSVVEAIKQHRFTTPYATFTCDGTEPDYTPSIWRQKDRAVHSFTQGGSISIVPRDIQAVLSSQVYDYPYIIKHKQHYLAEKALDIVYISNGEPDAERWYQHACSVTGVDIKRVQNVNGRMAAYKAAAELSDTAWFFAVFAKLELVENFDWAWQPDRLQEAKHYIFNSRNPVNGLEYGHMGMIAYNKQLVLGTIDSGLDFTLSKAHEVVPVLSGIAHYNQDAWTTWRTAFREVVKLKQFMETSPTMETEYRLGVWLYTAAGANAEYSTAGAQDALRFYQEVNGDYSKLMMSYEWDWLRSRFNDQYKN